LLTGAGRPADELGRNHCDLAAVLGTTRRFAEAETEYRRALTLWEKLAADFPDQPSYRSSIAYTYGANLAPVLTATSQTRAAEEAMRQCSARWVSFMAQFPNDNAYKVHLTQCRFELAAMLQTDGRWQEADAAYRTFLEIARTSAEGPIRFARLLATCPDPQVRDPKQAIELAKKAVELTPNEPERFRSEAAELLRISNKKE
jgi:tetratricopeptide (TPR) repeat protein